MAKAIYYQLNVSGPAHQPSDSQLSGIINGNSTGSEPIVISKMELMYEILRDKYTHKEFDKITEFSMPEMVWSSGQSLCTDYLRKAGVNLFSDYLGSRLNKTETNTRIVFFDFYLRFELIKVQ